jgi:hypothetical protein
MAGSWLHWLRLPQLLQTTAMIEGVAKFYRDDRSFAVSAAVQIARGPARSQSRVDRVSAVTDP